MKLAALLGQYHQLSPLFSQNLTREARNADKTFLVIFVVNWIIVGLLTSLSYGTYMLGILGGGVVTLLAFGAYALFGGTSMSRILFGMLIMAFPIIMIQQHLGRIEMHFHVFVVLAFMSLYKDILPLVAAALTIAVHHLLFTYLQLNGVTLGDTAIVLFNYGCGWDITFLHAAFVVLEAIVLGYVIYMITSQYLNSMQVLQNVDTITRSKDLTLLEKSNDEESRAFSAFIDALKTVLNTAKSSAMQTATITQKIGQITQALNVDAKAQKSTVHDITQASSVMKNKLHETNEHTLEAKAKVEEANSNLLAMQKHITQFAQDVEQTAQTENELSTKLNELTQSAEEIKNILTVISDVADQTNLLALNAAIEAARAGEHGRGFAVVADEVRKLAERTQRSLSEIHSTVNVVVQAINDASETMHHNAQMITTLSQTSSQVRTTLDATTTLVTQAARLSNSSSTNFNQNITHLDTLVSNINSVEAITSKNFDNVQNIVQTIDTLVKSASQLTQELESFHT